MLVEIITNVNNFVYFTSYNSIYMQITFIVEIDNNTSIIDWTNGQNIQRQNVNCLSVTYNVVLFTDEKLIVTVHWQLQTN